MRVPVVAGKALHNPSLLLTLYLTQTGRNVTFIYIDGCTRYYEDTDSEGKMGEIRGHSS
jgi:hypothetical protein